MFSKRRNLVGYAGVWGLGRSIHMGRTIGTIRGIHIAVYGPPMLLERYLSCCISRTYREKWGRRSAQLLVAQRLTSNWTYMSDFQVRRGGGGRRFLMFKWLLHKGLGGGILELLPQRRED